MVHYHSFELGLEVNVCDAQDRDLLPVAALALVLLPPLLLEHDHLGRPRLLRHHRFDPHWRIVWRRECTQITHQQPPVSWQEGEDPICAVIRATLTSFTERHAEAHRPTRMV